MSSSPDPLRSRAWSVLVLVLAAWSATGAGAADTAPSAAAEGKERAVIVDAVPGSAVKRVTLSPRAAQRIDLRTARIDEQTIVPVRTLGGAVVDPSAAGAGIAGALWVRVALSAPEWDALAKDEPARIHSLKARSANAAPILAQPAGRPPLESTKNGMLSVFYALPADAQVALGERVRVGLAFGSGSGKQKVVPYSAVYYDARGQAWVYVSTAALSFVRQPVTVDRVAGDLAVLSSGPQPGTVVATVGVSLLYGAEVFGK